MMVSSWKTFTLLIFFQFISASISAENDFGKLQIERFALFLEPKELILNYFNMRENDGWSNTTCEKDLSLLVTGIKKRETWAWQMLDATSKIPSGILKGNIVDLGVYDECISILGNLGKKEIRGKHCMYSFNVPKFPSSVTLSMCVPRSCDREDLKNILEVIKEKNNVTLDLENWKSDFQVTCSGVENREVSFGTIATFGLLCTIIIFLIICTILEYLQMKMKLKHKFVQELGKFSVVNSGKRILSMEVNPSTFPAIHGIRSLSIIWVVYGHVYTSRHFPPISNILDLDQWSRSSNSLYIYMSHFAVDTFFMLSGFLMTYLFLKEMKNNGKFNIFVYYFHRYLRLTPVVAVFLLMALYIVPHIGSGPFWENAMEKKIVGPCEEKWWTVLLYVQNYVRNDIECLGHTWYLAVDMQLYWISPIFLIPLAKKPKLGLAMLGIFFFISLITVGTTVAVNGYVSSLHAPAETPKLHFVSFRYMYAISHTRTTAWTVGVFLGYIISNTKLKKMQSSWGWTGMMICFIFCFGGEYITVQKDYKYNLTIEMINSMFGRPMWALGVAWIVYASINGFGGLIANFLSSSIFLPLSRLSYCIYIVHATLQIAKASSIRVPLYFTDFEMFSIFLNELIMTVITAFFFSIFFESPFLTLEKMIFKKKKVGVQKTKEIITQNGKNIHESA